MAVDSAARAVETLIDSAHLQLGLLRRDYRNALFHTLLASEIMLASTLESGHMQDRAIELDMLVNVLKPALAWVAAANGSESVDESQFYSVLQEARDLMIAASNYLFFTVAYTFASRDVIDLTLLGNDLRATRLLSTETRYEAYNMLLKPTLEERATRDIDRSEGRLLAEVKRAAARHVVPPSVPLVRSVLAAALDSMSPSTEPFYNLPPEWSFGSFSIGEFKRVSDAIRAVMWVWRKVAPAMNLTGVEYADRFPYTVNKRELRDAIIDVTGVRRGVVREILSLLTYGEHGILKPDPALQPLMPVTSDSLLLSSSLILGTATERNLTVLLNLLPEHRKSYAILTQAKEERMRARILSQLPSSLATWNGHLPIDVALPNVDLALIDAASRSLLLVELKWFIDPAEAREIDNRSEELLKGVAQCKQLLDAFASDRQLLRHITTAEIDDIAAIVLSANWIGFSNVQDAEVAVLNETHFLAKVRLLGGLSGLIPWLRSREYLPVENVHFTFKEVPIKYAGFTLNWYGLSPIETDAYLPL